MPVAIVFPKVSLETDVGTVARWLKDDGAEVAAGEVLFEIDNDKVAVEVEATAPGTLAHMCKAGDEVQVGAVVAQIFAAGEEPVAPVRQESAESRPAVPKAKVDPIAPSRSAASQRIVATPLARRMARQGNIDLSGVVGSGPRGRIQKRDLLDAGRARPAIEGSRLNAVWLQKEGQTTIVALHGFASDHNAWRSLLAAGRPKARFLALDLPGHGGSPRTVPGDLDAICEMVEATLASEGVKEAVVVAHSFGAAVAARLASRNFVSVESLLLMAPAGLGPEIRSEFINGFVAARQASSLVPWLHELVADPGDISQAFIRSVEEQRRDETLSHTLQEFAGRYFCDGTQTFSIRPDLEKLKVPVRVVFGTLDRIIPFAHCRALPGRVALHAFQHCGHLPFLEEPEMTLSILAEMLASVRGAQ